MTEPVADEGWPKMTIITPSYMQGGFIEHTIRSVLLQGYPDIEYFVLDGGSTDETREVIRKYEAWLSGWRSDRDNGQAATVNEGWRRATGEVLAWINSDDWYQPGAFAAVAAKFRGANPATWVAGPVDDCTEEGKPVRRHPAWPTPLVRAIGYKDYGLYQPGMFWHRTLIERVGSLDATMDCCFDLDFWARSLAAGFVLTPVDAPVACFRQHAASKSSMRLETILRDSWEIFRRYSPLLSPAERRQAADWLREYESDFLLHILYRRLREGRRASALACCLRKFRSLLKLRPRRLAWGCLLRIAISGRPPDWFFN